MTKEEVKKIKISDISPNPYQPRINFDQGKLEELSKSIEENGVLQPIIVRKSDILGYQLLAGERRFRASKLANMDYIPAIVRQLSDKEMMTLSILENLQRQDMSPLEEAKSYKNLIDKIGITHSELAKILGKSRPYVSNMVRILNLPQQVLELLEKEQISAGHARVLVSIDNENEQIRLANIAVEKKYSVRELEKQVSSNREDKNSKTTTSSDIFIKEMENDLLKKYGTQVKIKNSKSNTGKIEITFSSLEELNRIIEELS